MYVTQISAPTHLLPPPPQRNNLKQGGVVFTVKFAKRNEMWFVRLISFHFLFLPLWSGFAVYFSLCGPSGPAETLSDISEAQTAGRSLWERAPTCP